MTDSKIDWYVERVVFSTLGIMVVLALVYVGTFLAASVVGMNDYFLMIDAVHPLDIFEPVPQYDCPLESTTCDYPEQPDDF